MTMTGIFIPLQCAHEDGDEDSSEKEEEEEEEEEDNVDDGKDGEDDEHYADTSSRYVEEETDVRRPSSFCTLLVYSMRLCMYC